MPKNSPINTLADLKGKKIALNKGSNVHFLLVQALEKAGVKYSEITAIYLAPADARAAFERGAVDAWVIWDPFQAAAEAATGARTLTDATGLAPNRQFYFADQKFANANPAAVDAILTGIADIDRWADGKEKTSRKNSAPASASRRLFWKSHSNARPMGFVRSRCGGRRSAAHRRYVLCAWARPQAGRHLQRCQETGFMTSSRPPTPTFFGFCRHMVTAAISARRLARVRLASISAADRAGG